MDRYQSDTGYVTLLMVVTIPLAALGLTALVLGAANDMLDGGTLVAGFLFATGFGAVSFRLAYRALKPDQLILDDEGLTFISIGRTRHWKWSELERASFTRTRVTYGLFLHRKPSGAPMAFPISLGSLWKLSLEKPAAPVIAEAINRRILATRP